MGFTGVWNAPSTLLERLLTGKLFSVKEVNDLGSKSQECRITQKRYPFRTRHKPFTTTNAAMGVAANGSSWGNHFQKTRVRAARMAAAIK